MNNNDAEVKYHKEPHRFGQLRIEFIGEEWKHSGKGIQETEVKINGFQLCWVAWEERIKFLEKLNEVINKYRI